MTRIMSISRLFPRGRRRGAAAQQRLVEAYQRLFQGFGDKEDAELVLGDMTRYAGFFDTAPVEADRDEIVRFEGRRDSIARTLAYLNLPNEAMEALHEASLLENATTTEEDQEI